MWKVSKYGPGSLFTRFEPPISFKSFDTLQQLPISVRFVRCIHNFEYSLRVHRANSPISETDLPRRHKSPLEPIRRSSYGESHLIGQQDPEGLHRSRRLR